MLGCVAIRTWPSLQCTCSILNFNFFCNIMKTFQGVFLLEKTFRFIVVV